MKTLKIITSIFIYLIATSAYGEDRTVLACVNDSLEMGNYESKVSQHDGRGKVLVTIVSSNDSSVVSYDNRYTVRGVLNESIDTEIYIEDIQSDKTSYPFTKNRIRLNRHTGSGYFQSSIYKTPDSTPDFITESLSNCKPSKQRF